MPKLEETAFSWSGVIFLSLKSAQAPINSSWYPMEVSSKRIRPIVYQKRPPRFAVPVESSTKTQGRLAPPQRTENRERRTERPYGATDEVAGNSVWGKWTAKTQILQERWGANAGRTSVRPPAPHFPASSTLGRGHKREDDGREGTISGRLARKATGVSPSGFARTGVFAEKWLWVRGIPTGGGGLW